MNRAQELALRDIAAAQAIVRAMTGNAKLPPADTLDDLRLLLNYVAEYLRGTTND